MQESKLVRMIGEQVWIDRIADPVQGAIRSVLDRTPRLADLLHGTWFGHPLHPALVTLPLGAFSTAAIFDALELGGSRKFRRAADAALVIGLVSAALAIAPGLADWSRTHGTTKRVGFVHATMNTFAAGLYGASLGARAGRRRRLGIALAMAGFGVAGASAWLGGELAYRLDVPQGPEVKPEAPRTPAAERVGEARG